MHQALWGLTARVCLSVLAVALVGGCASKTSNPAAPPASAVEPEPVFTESPSPLQKKLAAMIPGDWVTDAPEAARLAERIEAFHRASPTRRGYLAVDKPLYRPGETVWFRAFDLQTAELGATAPDGHARFQLLSPKGAPVLFKQVRVKDGNAANDFVLPAAVPGGEYVITATTGNGLVVARPIIVSSYQPPRIKKKVKFLRKAYGEGDAVAAAISLHRATGEALRSQSITGVVTLDGAELVRVPLSTDLEGKVIARFTLPASIAVGDGLLTVLVNDGGITESIQKRIPITLKALSLATYAEGGQLVSGLPGRVYFAAKNALGKPADIEGRVTDDRGQVVASLRSLHDGMGRFELTPAADRRYKVEILRPAGIEQTFELAPAIGAGCSMQSVDDLAGQRAQVRVAVWCSTSRLVVATGAMREKTLTTAAVRVTAGDPTVIALPLEAARARAGAVRVTLFDGEMTPLAERLIYRATPGAQAGLQVSIVADRPQYNPRDPVSLTIETRDGAGSPVAADLALSVVDDSVLSFADDKTAAMLARVLLEAEMPGQRIEEPNFYFSDDPKAAAGRDLVLGTQGWRRFDWKQAFAPKPTGTAVAAIAIDGIVEGAPEPARKGAIDERANKRPAAKPADDIAGADRAAAPPMADPEPAEAGEINALRAEPVLAEKKLKAKAERLGARLRGGNEWDGNADKEWAGDVQKPAMVWAPVRTFPVPTYSAEYNGPRNDFRETIYWQPQVRTDKDGKATVTFVTSDAITSFLAVAEGTAASGLGRGEALITSKLPVSVAVKLPTEVSTGDRLRLPVTITNESRRRMEATLASTIGAAFAVRGTPPPTRMTLEAGERQSFFTELEVVGSGASAADGAVRFSATAARLRDEVERTIAVSPRGFPTEISVGGTVASRNRHEIVLPQMHDGSLRAELVMYPSPLSTMIEGTQAIIREPTGCFEQASSANYPNIMVLDYLQSHGNADPALIEKTQGMLDRGYKKLTGYESKARGYEWFGGDPGHEALTAYGLMEFVDMTAVYADVDRPMIERTATWLKSRRDGKGGYKRNSRALDSFGAASPEVTNAYITYALALAGQSGIGVELDAAAAAATSTSDPYVLALSAGALLAADRAATGRAATARLAARQAEDGSFVGAKHSITRSGGVALTIETTSLAALAMMKAGHEHDARLRRAITWLDKNRNGFGGYGSTQSTVLALKAMTAYAEHSAQTKSDGVATVFVNGRQVERIAYAKGHSDALTFNLGAHLASGKNVVEVALESKNPLPYSMAVTYSSDVPSSSPDSVVGIETALGRTSAPMGEGVTMKVRVKNLTKEGIPMAIARIGLPGGLSYQTWQLVELRDKKLIDFYETRDREVVLYFRSMAPERVAEINLELLASVPGTFVAPASRAYLYYTDEHKSWSDPVTVTVR